MAPQTLVRWSGAALILGGLCLAAFMLVHAYGVVFYGAGGGARPGPIPVNFKRLIGLDTL